MTQHLDAENIYISYYFENNMNITISQGFYKVLCWYCISDLFTSYLSVIAVTNIQFIKLIDKWL